MQVFTVTNQYNSLMTTVVNDGKADYVSAIAVQLDLACGIDYQCPSLADQSEYILESLSDKSEIMVDLWQNGIPIWVYVLNV
jgi:hypothetical protein